jgi:hypothetical protein
MPDEKGEMVDQAGQEIHLMRFARAMHRSSGARRVQTSSLRTHHPHSVEVAPVMARKFAASAVATMSDSFMNLRLVPLRRRVFTGGQTLTLDGAENWRPSRADRHGRNPIPDATGWTCRTADAPPWRALDPKPAWLGAT